MTRRVGILTGGGDVPGLNSAIKAFACRMADAGYEVLGLRRGWAALLHVLPYADADNSAWMMPLTRGTTRITPGAPTSSTAVEAAPTQTLAHTGSHTLNDANADPDDFFTPHVGVGMFLFADGSVRPLQNNVDLTLLQALSTRACGEVVSGEW